MLVIYPGQTSPQSCLFVFVKGQPSSFFLYIIQYLQINRFKFKTKHRKMSVYFKIFFEWSKLLTYNFFSLSCIFESGLQILFWCETLHLFLDFKFYTANLRCYICILTYNRLRHDNWTGMISVIMMNLNCNSHQMS